MILKCNAICKKVNKKSGSPAFKELKEGDKIEFSIEIGAVGVGSKGRTYAAYIKCLNIQTGVKSRLSFNQIGKTLECFEFEQIV